MIDDLFEVIRLPITFEQFEALPQSPTCKYEYLNSYALLSPRPKSYSALLDLHEKPVPATIDARGPIVIRLLREEDWDRLPKIFASAFSRFPPFAGLGDNRRLEAARRCLEKTRAGGDGPHIPPACFVAVAPEDRLVGPALVTLASKYDEDEIREIAPDGTLPHLTWIFVAPLITRYGIGSAMLNAATNALISLGHRTLVSSFLLGHEASTLWHWINGFRVLSYLASPRRIRHEVQASRTRQRDGSDPPNR